MTSAPPGGSAPGIPASLSLPSLAGTLPGRREVVTAASLAAAVLAATSTGSVVVAAVLLGVGTLDRRSGIVAVLAATATSIRFRTAAFDDLAGIQSVLGPAGVVGPELAAASAWCAAVAILLATRVPALDDGHRWRWRFAPPLASGLLAAALVAGPGPADLWLRLGASALAVVLAAAATALDRRPVVVRVRLTLALLVAAVAVVLAGWPA